MTTTRKPYLSFNRKLSSSACVSKGFIIKGTPSLNECAGIRVDFNLGSIRNLFDTGDNYQFHILSFQ